MNKSDFIRSLPPHEALCLDVVEKSFSAGMEEGARMQLDDILMGITDNERLEIFSRFCVHCGTADPGCQCWNDE